MPADPAAGRAPLLLHVFSTFAVGGPQMRFVALAAAFGPRYRHIVMAMDGRPCLRGASGARAGCALRAHRGGEGCHFRQRSALPTQAARDRSRCAGDLQLGCDRVGDGEHPAPRPPHPRRGRLRAGGTRAPASAAGADAAAGAGAQHGGGAVAHAVADRDRGLAARSAPGAVCAERHRSCAFRGLARSGRRAGDRHRRGAAAGEEPGAAAARVSPCGRCACPRGW